MLGARANLLEIHGSFVRHVTESPDDPLFVKAINEVSQGLNIKTVAECVESEAVLDELQRIGVDFAQGFFVAAPLPIAQLTA